MAMNATARRWLYPDLRPVSTLGLGRRWTRSGLHGCRWRRGFTLIELLTVITIVAILATLLMTTLSSAKRRAREAVCTSNLHQIGIALHLYLDDYPQRPPDLETLVTSKYLTSGDALRCPADRGSSVASLTDGAIKNASAPAQASNATPRLHVSYQHPLAWPNDQWDRLMQAQTRAGIAVCPFHDVRSPSPNTAQPGGAVAGFILRGQLDGTVVRRQVYPSDTQASAAAAGPAQAAPPSNLAGPNGTGSQDQLNPTDPPWGLFSDDPSK